MDLRGGGREQDMSDTNREFQSLTLAILTISDSRTRENDTSGDLLQECAEDTGHRVMVRQIVPDDRYRVRAVVSEWIASAQIQVILTTGGTGLTGRDGTPEAILPLNGAIGDPRQTAGL